MPELRFAFVLTSLAGGGAEKAIVKLAAGLRARGHAVTLVLLEDAAAGHAPPEGVQRVVLTAGGRPASKGWLGRRRLARRLRERMRELAGNRPFDLVVSTLPLADEVAVLARLERHWCRIANTLSAELARLAPAKARRRLARYRRVYGSRPLIAVSRGVADDLREQLGLRRTRIEVIHNAFDLEAMRAAAREPAPLPGEPYVVHVGRFAGQKRHDLLLAAFGRVTGVRRLVLLAAPDPALAALIERNGLAARVTVAGFQANPYPWIAGARLLVLCSDHEGLPNVIIEALAVGTPVVSTDCPSGPREIVGDAMPEALVPCGDAAALAAAIERSLAQPPSPGRVDLSAYAAPGVIARYEALAAQA